MLMKVISDEISTMSQAHKEYAFQQNPSLLDDNLRLDPEYDIWADRYDTETEKELVMKMDQMYPSSSTLLKAADLAGKAVKKTIADIEMVDLGDKVKPVLKFEGTDRELALNKTNAMIIVSMYGDDSNNWMGKEITMYSTKVDFQGKPVDAIRIQPQFESPAGMDDDIPF